MEKFQNKNTTELHGESSDFIQNAEDNSYLDEIDRFLDAALRLPKPLDEKSLDDLTPEELKLVQESSWKITMREALMRLGKEYVPPMGSKSVELDNNMKKYTTGKNNTQLGLF